MGLIQDLLDRWQDGRIKLFVTSRGLNFRRDHDLLFLEGAYQPLQATGPNKEKVFAFVRHTNGAWAVTAVPRLVTNLVPAGLPPTGERVWAARRTASTGGAPSNWVNVLTGERLRTSAGKLERSLPLADVFNQVPCRPAGSRVNMKIPETSSYKPSDDPLWYKDAVFYEVHVRAFCDSDGDGTGDFRGLAQKLDYLEDLGVNTIWLLPFYPSPLKDDGYDISDYTNIHPSFGTMEDFQLCWTRRIGGE